MCLRSNNILLVNIEPLDHWIIQFKFSVTWSCVSLPRPTTSSYQKLVLFVKLCPKIYQCFKILPIVMLIILSKMNYWKWIKLFFIFVEGIKDYLNLTIRYDYYIIIFFIQLAKSAFQARKDPLDAALFYMAMKKKNVLWGLFRYVSCLRVLSLNPFNAEIFMPPPAKRAKALCSRAVRPSVRSTPPALATTPTWSYRLNSLNWIELYKRSTPPAKVFYHRSRS